MTDNLKREIIEFQSEKEWLGLRNLDLTSTQASALFGCNPYQTEFELYHERVGTLISEKDFSGDRIKWGNRLEESIGFGIAEDLGIIVQPLKVYGRIPELRIGASFDFKVIGIVEDWVGKNDAARNMFEKHGPGLMEVKNVDGLQFRRKWIDESEEIEAPPHIEIQAQHQLLVLNMPWSVIGALVGGNTPKVIVREADEGLHAAIIKESAEFWRRVDELDAPAPDYTKDGKTIGKLNVDNDGSIIDLSGDPRVFILCKTYKDSKLVAKEANERADAAKAELLMIIGKAKSVTATGFKISAGTNRATYKAYSVDEQERATITITKMKAFDVEAEVPSFRNVRITAT